MFLISRVMLLAVGYLAVASLETTPTEREPIPFALDVWSRWDGGWYISIAREGYFYRGQQETSSIAFFPLYPLLIKITAPFTGGSMVVAGLLVSHLCLLAACLLLYDLARHETDDEAAQRAVLYLLIAPGSLFFSAVYTESLFLLLSVAVFWAARQQRWGWAILAAMFATTTRAVGLLLWGVVLWELMRVWWAAASTPESNHSARLLGVSSRIYVLIAVFASLIPLGLVSFMVFNAVQFNDPSAFSKAQAAWGRTGAFNLNFLYEMQRLLRTDWSHLPLNVPSLMNLIACVAGGLMIIPVWRRWGAAYGGYALLSWLVPVLSSTIASQSLMRYITVIFPFFMVLGVWGKSRLIDTGIMMIFLLLLGLLTIVFVTGRFAG